MYPNVQNPQGQQIPQNPPNPQNPVNPVNPMNPYQSTYQDPEPERVLGTWHRSMSSPGFWWRVVFTFTLYYWIIWQRSYIMVTNRRVTHYVPRLVGGAEISIAYDNITDVEIDTSPLGALLKFADIRIQTAGGGRTPEVYFKAIEKPDQLKAAIFAMQDRFRQMHPPRGGGY